MPIAKSAAVLLPNNMPFTRLEALFSLQLDHHNKSKVSVVGMVKRWGWSRKRVRTFLDRVGVEIVYPKSTAKCRNQRGHIRGHKRDISTEKRGHIKLIDFSVLQTEGAIPPQNRGHKRDISGATTKIIDKDNKKNTAFSGNAVGENGDSYRTKKGRKLTGWKLRTFLDFWTAFNLKKGKAEAADIWLEISSLHDTLAGEIIKAAKVEALRRPELIEKGHSPKWAQGWLSGRRWEDEHGSPGQKESKPAYRRILN